MSDKVSIDFHVLCPLIKHWIFGNVHCSQIVNLIGIGVIVVRPSSWSNLLSHESSATSLLMLLYSASAEDKEMVVCFVDFYAINVSPRKTTKPLIDFLL